MLNHLRLHRILWAVTALLTLAAAAAGVARPGIYAGIVSSELIPGAFSQDLLSLAAGVGLAYLAFAAGPGKTKHHIAALGILGYLFYAYGIYVIERAYNGLYLAYMGIFTLAFWALVLAGAHLKRDLPAPALPRGIRWLSAAGGILQPLIFYPLWIGMLLPLMSSGDQIDSLYSIFILDLCFIMPGFLILSVMTFMNRAAGLLLLPALYVLGFTLIFSLAMGELAKPLFGAAPSLPALGLSLSLSLLFLVLGILHLKKLRLDAAPVGAAGVPGQTERTNHLATGGGTPG